jgi:hypothetical protein
MNTCKYGVKGIFSIFIEKIESEIVKITTIKSNRKFGNFQNNKMEISNNANKINNTAKGIKTVVQSTELI